MWNFHRRFEPIVRVLQCFGAVGRQQFENLRAWTNLAHKSENPLLLRRRNTLADYGKVNVVPRTRLAYLRLGACRKDSVTRVLQYQLARMEEGTICAGAEDVGPRFDSQLFEEAKIYLLWPFSAISQAPCSAMKKPDPSRVCDAKAFMGRAS